MAWRFSRHYSVEEARALLPEIRGWMVRLRESKRRLLESEARVAGFLAKGHDVGGTLVNRSLQTAIDTHRILEEFRTREILIKDLERGLIDFPAFREDREVFLCWEHGEEDIEHWHSLDAGYAGRQPL